MTATYQAKLNDFDSTAAYTAYVVKAINQFFAMTNKQSFRIRHAVSVMEYHPSTGLIHYHTAICTGGVAGPGYDYRWRWTKLRKHMRDVHSLDLNFSTRVQTFAAAVAYCILPTKKKPTTDKNWVYCFNVENEICGGDRIVNMVEYAAGAADFNSTLGTTMVSF